MSFDYGPLILTFKLAIVTTLILMVVGIPLAYWVAFTRCKWKYFVEPLISMPLVLPPTVLGFYILLLFSPRSFLGNFLETFFHVQVVFTFLGLVIGSVLFSLPFMVNPIKAGLQSFPKSLIEASYALGKSRRETLIKVILPNIKPALLTGIVMAFAHTIGEFGVVLMIGGSIPGDTRTASIAIFGEVEALNYTNAHFYSAILFCVSFIILFILNSINRKAFDIIR
ncbi:MAG: molybdate ABC transporter permease subunit [Candidatus Omnitrophica bacterium]|nr:molybdate ABC transporter permease subunit [Candidatus Omnitrophota bacterium]